MNLIGENMTSAETEIMVADYIHARWSALPFEVKQLLDLDTKQGQVSQRMQLETIWELQYYRRLCDYMQKTIDHGCAGSNCEVCGTFDPWKQK